MDSATRPFPIPALDIPAGHCYNPANLSTKVAGDMVTFSWDSPHDNDGFRLQVYEDATKVYDQYIFGVAVQLKLKPNKKHTWILTTYCDRVADRKSGQVLGAPFITGDETFNCPVINIANSLIIKSSKSVRLQWTVVVGVQQYELEIIPSGINTIPIKLSTFTNFVNLTLLVSGRKYIWRVKPVCSGGEFSEWGEFETGPGGECGKVDIKAQINITTGIIYWTNLETAISYQIYLNGTLLAAEHPVNIFTLQYLSPHTAYDLLVIPNCSNGTGDMNVINFETLDYPVQNPTNLKAVFNSSKQLVISWTPVEVIDSQEIMINGSKYDLPATANTYFILLPASDTKYNILVRSVKGSEKSTGAFVQSETITICQRPGSISVISKNHNSISISWPGVSKATKYRVGYFTTGLPDWVEFDVNDNSITFKSLNANTQYSVRVKTICQNDISEPTEEVIQTMPIPQCPQAINLYATDLLPTSFKINFSLTEDAETGVFKVSVKQGANPAVFFSGKSSPIAITGLLENLPYTVIVQNNCSSNPSVSVPIDVTTPKSCIFPTDLAGSLTTSNTVLAATWTAAAGAINYRFKYRKVNDLLWTTAPDQPGVTISLPAESAVYEIEVSSLYADGRICPTASVFVIPKVLGVQNNDQTIRSAVMWKPIEGVDFYKVLVTSLDKNYEFRVPFASIDTFFSPLVSYSITVQAFYNSVGGTISDALVYVTNNELPVDDNCNGPLIIAFSQDSHINDSTVTVDTKVDISVKIADFNKDFRYKVAIVHSGYIVPIQIEYIDDSDINPDGEVYFEKLPKPAEKYLAFVTRYAPAGEENCVKFTTVEPAECAIPTGLASSAITSDGFTLNWDDMTVPNYKVCVSAVGHPDIEYTVNTNTLVVAGLEENLDYNVKIKSLCINSLESAYSSSILVHTIIP